MSIYLIIISVILSMCIGYKLGIMVGTKTGKKYAQAFVDDIRQKTLDVLIRVYVEEVDGEFFVYDTATSKYLTRGKDLVEINENLKKINSTSIYWIHPDDAKEFNL